MVNFRGKTEFPASPLFQFHDGRNHIESSDRRHPIGAQPPAIF